MHPLPIRCQARPRSNAGSTGYLYFSRPTRFGDAYRGELERSRNVTVYLHSTATRLETEGARIIGVSGRSGDHRFRITARRYVLACRASDRLLGTWHHLGTTRMNDDPNLGVVDRDCRVHGLANLFVRRSPALWRDAVGTTC